MTESGRTSTGTASSAEVLARNVEGLRLRDQELARRVERAAPLGGAVVLASKAGPPTMRVHVHGREVHLASAYDPEQEASRLVHAQDTRSFGNYFVLGFGLGYHVEELHRRAHPKTHIFVFEASLELFRTTLETRDLTSLVNSERVHVLVALEKPEIFAALNAFVTPILVGTRVLPHAPSVEAFAEDYARLRRIIQDFITYAYTCLKTTVDISAQSRQNVMMNAPYYCFCAGINELEGLFKGYPAVVVAAGPSLQRNIDQLKRVKGRGVIIAMSTSLKPLLARGIVPDYTCMIDFSWLSRKYFTGLEKHRSITMVTDAKSDPGTLDIHQGPKLVLKDNYIDLVLKGVGPAREKLRPGATVAHLAFYLAEFIGADPIVFVGQDLSFPDGITYTPGTAIHDLWQLETNRFQTLEMKEWERILRMRGVLFKVKDASGSDIYTDQQMFTYLQQFERDFHKSSALIIDATEGGAAKSGTTAMTFTEAFDRYFTREIPSGLLDRARNPRTGMLPVSKTPELLEKVEARICDAEDIRDFYAESLQVLREIQMNLDDAARTIEFQQRVDRLRREVEKRHETNVLVSMIVQDNEYLKRRRDRAIAGADLSDRERKERQLERDVAYVQGLHQGAMQLIEILKLAYERISDYEPSASSPGDAVQGGKAES